MKINSLTAAGLCTLAILCQCAFCGEDAKSDNPPPPPPPPADAPKPKIISEEERDQRKEQKIRIEGRILIETDPKAQDAKKAEDYDGYLITTSGPLPFKAEDEDAHSELLLKANETVTLEGRLRQEPEKWLLVKRIVSRPQPPSDVRNPRGL